jgi:hypothetical protein
MTKPDDADDVLLQQFNASLPKVMQAVLNTIHRHTSKDDRHGFMASLASAIMLFTGALMFKGGEWAELAVNKFNEQMETQKIPYRMVSTRAMH